MDVFNLIQDQANVLIEKPIPVPTSSYTKKKGIGPADEPSARLWDSDVTWDQDSHLFPLFSCSSDFT